MLAAHPGTFTQDAAITGTKESRERERERVLDACWVVNLSSALIHQEREREIWMLYTGNRFPRDLIPSISLIIRPIKRESERDSYWKST